MDDDSSDCRERNTRKNIANILKGLGFENTPESRKLDPWMTSVLSSNEQQQQEIDQQQQQQQYTPRVRKEEKEIKIEITRPRKPDHNHDSCSRKSTTRENIRASKRELHAELRRKILGEMGGSDLKFLFEKRLTVSDIVKEQNRLLIPTTTLENEFLNEEEKTKLEDYNTKEESKKKKGSSNNIMARILVYDEDCDYNYEGDWIKLHDIKLTKRSNKSIVMNGVWHSLVEEYRLEEDMFVELWAFRVDSQLFFALIKIKKPTTASSSSS